MGGSCGGSPDAGFVGEIGFFLSYDCMREIRRHNIKEGSLITEMQPGKREHDKRLLRIVSMLHALGNGRTLNPRDLAGEHAVSLRTVQRDVELLERVGLPLIRNERGRFKFMRGFQFGLPAVHRKASGVNP